MTRPHEMMRRVSAIDQTAIGLTDHGNSYAVAEFQKFAKKQGIKLIAGNEFYIAVNGLEDRSERKAYHLTVLCDGSKEGWTNLCRLHHISFAKGFYYNPRIDLDTLAKHADGLIALSGCLGGLLPKAILASEHAAVGQRIKDLVAILGKDRFFIELQNHGLDEDRIVLPVLRSLAKKHGLQTVATNDAHYAEEKDHVAHDVLICMGTGSRVGDPTRQKVYVPREFYLKDYDEMAERGFSKAELTQSQKIADMCEELNLESKSFRIPDFCKNPVVELKARVKDGIEDRYGIQLSRPAQANSALGTRVKYELDTITKAGFANYLLIVADIYDFMREEKIPYGPGRGSVGGSIVAYAIGITDVDPIRYGLPFERFINSERISMPDVDMDISAVHRDRVAEYIRNKYGEDKTGSIITFQSLGARAAIRDISRAFGVSLDKVDPLAKSVPQEGSLTKDRESRSYLEQAIASQKVLQTAYKDPEMREVLEVGMRLEGVTKAASKHAAGLVISNVPLKDIVPTGIKTKGADPDPTVVGFEMNYLEDMGLIKFDLLGLRNLDIVADCIADMKANKDITKSFTPEDIPLDDAATFDMLSRGLTQGVFQLESSGMAGWLRKLKPNRVEDVMAMVALYRPGPMEMIPSYVKRKCGEEEITYPHKSLKPVLEETYGIPLYQEQLMRIGEVIAGWTLARADQLRKVIGKKIIDDIAKERKQFANDAKKNGFDWEWADELFESFIEPAARYGFNKAHSCAYGLLAYQTAYLKCNYPTYYFAALLKSIEDHPSRDERMSAYIADAREMGVAILPPDINKSGKSFTALPEERSVLFGLNGIKYVPSKAVDEIIRERGRGEFTDLFSTVERIKSTHCNSRAIESLVAAGALDELPGNRASKLASLPDAMVRADGLSVDRKRIAEGGKAVNRKKALPETTLLPKADDKIVLLGQERELVGYYLSSHPYLDQKDKINAKYTIGQAWDGVSEGSFGGIVSRLKEHTTKKAKSKMLFGAIEDDRAVLEFVVFPRQYSEMVSKIKLDEPVVLHGRIDREGEDEDSRPKLIVSKVETVGRGVRAMRESTEETITLDPKNYRKQIQEIRRRVENKDKTDLIDIRLELPNGDVVKLIA
jgi:DNA polymerase-3 subunit alpha